MEELLIVSNYYPPEKGAAANRIEQLAKKLVQNNYKVTVVCPLPNYPEGAIFKNYKGKFFVNEIQDGIQVNRLWIYPSVSKNIFKRILSIFSFSLCLFFYLFFKKTPHKIVIQSPPLLLSSIAVFVLSFKRKKIILNISDLWPHAAIELGVLKANTRSHKMLLKFEKYIYSKATLILGQSNEILDHLTTIIPEPKGKLYRNFPDHAVKEMALKEPKDTTIRIFYAGLLGVAQGVYEICQYIHLKGTNIELHIFGDGAERVQIEDFIKNNPENNIYFHGMLDRKDLHERLKEFDIAFVPLTTRIFGSVPSKIFEYATLGFPILYFGGGEGEDIIYENELGWVAEVGNKEALNTVLKEIDKTPISRITEQKKEVFYLANKNFNLDLQMKTLIAEDTF